MNDECDWRIKTYLESACLNQQAFSSFQKMKACQACEYTHISTYSMNELNSVNFNYITPPFHNETSLKELVLFVVTKIGGIYVANLNPILGLNLATVLNLSSYC